MPLYPEIEITKEYLFKVDKVHEIYVEECGNQNGIPVIFLHGGPGSACNANHRRYFNPKKYRVILFDQRGCGRSKPHGNLENNTTQHLIADIETICEKLGVKKLVLFAGSWGVTLALLFAQQNPQAVLGMVLRGSFLASERDLSWFFNDGVSRIYPELWENLNETLPALADETLIETYYRCLFSEDKALNQKAAKAWSDWTDTVVTWTLSNTDKADGGISKSVESDNFKNITDKQIRGVRLEVFYAFNNYFLRDNHLLNNMEGIKHLSAQIVHGRKDITCPVESSWRLHKKLHNSNLTILPNAGHLAGEPDMIEALVKATDKMIDQVS